jgi:hypothetical protein
MLGSSCLKRSEISAAIEGAVMVVVEDEDEDEDEDVAEDDESEEESVVDVLSGDEDVIDCVVDVELAAARRVSTRAKWRICKMVGIEIFNENCLNSNSEEVMEGKMVDSSWVDRAGRMLVHRGQ